MEGETKVPLAYINDADLVRRSQLKDSLAFEELVRRYRSMALHVAKTVLSDPYVADDITQEAMLKAYLQLHSLKNPSSFPQWLKKIVKNFALMKVREGDSKKELLISLDEQRGEDGHLSTIQLASEKEHILAEAKASQSPLEALLRKELQDGIYQLLECLTQKEKPIFHAFIFEELSIAEIAKKFDINSSYVYQIISRSRKKLTEATIRYNLQSFLKENAPHIPAKKMDLFLPGSLDWTMSLNTFGLSLYRIVNQFFESHLSFSLIMGLSTQAFRINLERESIAANSSSVYYWEPVFSEGIKNLGYSCTFTGDGGVSPTPFSLMEGIDFIHYSILQGSPVISWGISGSDFGIIYGYDQEQQLFRTEGVKGARFLPYVQLGRGAREGLFVLSLRKETPIEKRHIANALEGIIKHAYSERTFTGYVAGIAAYDAWIEAVDQDTYDQAGHDQNVQIVLDARRSAYQFLYELAEVFSGEQKQLCIQAAAKYKRVGTIFFKLKALKRNTEKKRMNCRVNEAIIHSLRQAKQEEESGIKYLSHLLHTLRSENAKTTFLNKLIENNR